MICEQVDQTLNDLEMLRKEALKVANSPYGPWMYADALEQDGEILKQLSKGNDYAEYARRFLNIRKFAVLSRKKDEEVSDEKREQVKLLRDQIKKGIASLQEQYFYQSPQEMLEELKAGKVQPFGEVRVKGAGLRKMAQLSVEGVLDKAFRRNGDLVIVTEVEFPDRLTDKQREAIQRLF